ncbi:chemotaxis protein CheW [Pseudenhygromyxa sp. WMMC2535]|uniref:chemotaxis protein CheW n=1 Tax=Pseudenhygromyxa sp. WMMC2535 TaxID=2712867 RepID=UPI001556DBA2|nr:chemotaxis protein CheW [Pseudenhygromyxa sp. WMMC2535]NVB42179.1 chemotaxis protein CheW [Pseudenhygromyxa sp. WMMC2535]
MSNEGAGSSRITSTAWGDEQAPKRQEQLKLAGFYVGGGLYGIDIMRIKEVIQAAPYPLRPVPHAPDIIEGVITLRGVVIPVIDLRKRFGVAPDEESIPFNKLIIVSVKGRIVGLKVDRVLGELRVDADEVRPAPSMLSKSAGAGEDEDFFSGVCKIGDDIVFVVHLEGLIITGKKS